jgi:hypothetical protein
MTNPFYQNPGSVLQLTARARFQGCCPLPMAASRCSSLAQNAQEIRQEHLETGDHWIDEFYYWLEAQVLMRPAR